MLAVTRDPAAHMPIVFDSARGVRRAVQFSANKEYAGAWGVGGCFFVCGTNILSYLRYRVSVILHVI